MDTKRGKVKLEGVVKVFDVKAFRIAKYPVTNVQFQAFIDAEDGYQNAEWWKDIETERKAIRAPLERSQFSSGNRVLV